MTKYLRCHTNGNFVRKGERYEVTHEDDRCYYTENVGQYTKEPDAGGRSYRNWFTLETDEQPCKVDGRKAEIISPGERYQTYRGFAEKHGYPDAAAIAHRLDRRKRLSGGDVVTLLVSGKHGGTGATLWIVETANGERHIIGEKGLRILSEEVANITVLKDESLGGIEREYREVKRKAAVGERIKIVKWADSAHLVAADVEIGEVLTVKEMYGRCVHAVEERYLACSPIPEEYVVLEPTDIIRIDDPDGVNRGYRMVDRRAAVGERVIVVDAKVTGGGTYRNGAILTVNHVGPGGGIEIDTEGRDMVWYLWRKEYRVLEPVDSAAPTVPLSAQPPLDQAAANISALTAKVQALESRVATLEKANQPVKVAEGPADDAPPSFAIPRNSGKSFAKLAEAFANVSRRLAVEKSPQQIRDEMGCKPLDRDAVVERAKADVKALLKQRVNNVPTLGGLHAIFNLSLHGDITDSVKFIVNREKRTVTALIYAHATGQKPFVWARGIAKCAPIDVFNAHIGRAISLRRALGLEVPAEYLNVPNPEEPRVGDVVVGGVVYAVRPTRRTYKTTARDTFMSHTLGYTYIKDDFEWWAHLDRAVIIDDSRESVEEVGA